MRSINQEISDLLNKHISIQKCLKRDIINSRALAKFLIKNYSLTYSIDSVISAIRRYDLDNVSLLNLDERKEIFSKMSISTKDNVAIIRLKDNAFREICEDFLGKKILRNNLRLIKSKEKITLIVKNKDLDKKLSLFKVSEQIKTIKGLSEIRLQFEKDISNVKGIVARVSAELALSNINIEDVIYGVPDILIYIKEKDLISAHDTLMKLKG